MWYKLTCLVTIKNYFNLLITSSVSSFINAVAEGGEKKEKKTFTRQISSEQSNVTEENEGSEVGKIVKMSEIKINPRELIYLK